MLHALIKYNSVLKWSVERFKNYFYFADANGVMLAVCFYRFQLIKYYRMTVGPAYRIFTGSGTNNKHIYIYICVPMQKKKIKK